MTVKELYEIIGGDFEDAKSRLINERLVAKFVVKFPNDPSYQSLVTAYESQNAEEIFRAAHTLKGVCANLALKSLQSIASNITEAYRPGHEDQREGFDLKSNMDALSEKYDFVVAKIMDYAKENE